MSVLITGASGFVGLNIAEALVAQGREVVLFSNAPLPQAAREALTRQPGRMHAVLGDVRERRDLDQAFSEFRPSQVVHAAAMTPGVARERTEGRATFEVNVLGTLTALEAAATHAIGRFVYVSSGAVYGRSAFEVRVLDEAKTAPAPENFYAVSKLAAERLSLRFGELAGLDVRACRLSSVFGPWERDTGVRETLSPIFQVTRLALAGEAAVLPRSGPRDWIYSRDVAAAIVAILDAPAPSFDLYNIAPGVTWTVEQWCANLVRQFPHFSYRLAEEPVAANVDFWSERDRAPLASDRLESDLGFRAAHGLDTAFADFMQWLKKTAQPLS